MLIIHTPGPPAAHCRDCDLCATGSKVQRQSMIKPIQTEAKFTFLRMYLKGYAMCSTAADELDFPKYGFMCWIVAEKQETPDETSISDFQQAISGNHS